MKNSSFIIIVLLCTAIAISCIFPAFAGYNAVDAMPEISDEFMSGSDTWETGLYISNITEVKELYVPNRQMTYPVIYADAPCEVTLLKSIALEDGPVLGASVAFAELDEAENLMKTGSIVQRDGVVTPDGIIEAGAVYRLDPGTYFMDSVAASQGIIIVVAFDAEDSFEPPANDAFEVFDSNGNVYTLNKPLMGFVESDPIVYVVSEGTVVTAPEGIIFIYRIGESMVNPDAAGGDAPNSQSVSFPTAECTYTLKTSAGTTIDFMCTFEADDEHPNVSTPSVVPFEDVPNEAYFYEPVQWAVAAGVTNGTSDTTFSPEKLCTRAQILTFLWRANSCPENDLWSISFEDVANPNAYYVKALKWALHKGLIEDGGKFEPNAPCTRAETVVYLFKLIGNPPAPVAAFEDVKEDSLYAGAVNWAVAAGVTTGTSKTTFSPDKTCTRGQIVTFLHRYFNIV